MAIDFNQIPGLSYNEWIKIPHNKALHEKDQNKAQQRFIEEEQEYIQQIVLQERIQQDRQQTLQNQLRSITEVSDNTNVANMATPGVAAGAAGGASSGGGGFSFKTGWGHYSIGTYLDENLNHVNKLVDEGYERWTIS